MKYDILIGSMQVDIDSLEITFDKTEELDFGVFVIPATTRFQNYQILETVTITATDNEDNVVTYDPFVVISDKVEPVSRYGYYKHTITVIESVHKYEKLLSGNLFFTQSKTGTKKSLLDVLERLRNTVPFELASIHEQTRVFDIDEDLATYLDTIEAPQFFFQDRNLREMLNDIASFVNSIARIQDGNILIFDFYNEILNLIGIDEDIVNKTLSNQTKNFTSSVQTKLENAISSDDDEKAVIHYPTDTTYVSYRPESLKLTDTDYAIQLPFEIETMIGLKYAPKVSVGFYQVATFADLTGMELTETIYYVTDETTYYYYSTGDSAYHELTSMVQLISTDVPNNQAFIRIEIDVTSLIYTKDQWNRLDLDTNTTNGRNTANYKVNTLFYEIGGKKISNGLLAGVFQDISGVTAFFRRAMSLSPEIEFAYNTVAEIDDRHEQQFRVSYIPYFRTTTRLEKDNINDQPFNTQMNSNQADRIVSAEKLANKVFGLSQRLGQDEIEVTRYYSDLTETFNLGDITEDNFVVSKSHYRFYLNYFTVTYLFTKNFNRFSNRIAFSQENRSFDIPLNARTTTRQLNYSEYVELNSEYLNPNSIVSFRGKKVFMNSFEAVHSVYNEPIQFATIWSPQMDTDDVTSGESLYRKVVSFGEGNALNFVWEFEDVLQAGDLLVTDAYVINDEDETLPVQVKQYVKYTDTNGELEDLQVKFFHDTDSAIISNALPVVVTPTDELIGNTDVFKVYKDAGEALAMNFQLNVVPHYNHANNFVVGNELLKSNNLIKTLEDKTLYVWLALNGEYTSLDKLKAKGTRLGVEQTFTIGWDYTDINDNTTWQPYVEFTDLDVSSYDSWAIADASGNLLLGVNTKGENLQRVYFNFRNKRDNLNYTFSDTPLSYVLPPLLYLTPGESNISANWVDQQSSTNFEYGIRDLTDAGDWTDIGTTTLTGYVFEGLTVGHQYEIRVRAYADEAWSVYAYNTAYPTMAPPQVVINNVSAYSPTALRVYWEDVPNEQAYEVQQKTSIDNWLTTDYSAYNTTYYTYAVDTNTVYDHRVRAYNPYGYGDWSEVRQGIILASVPAPTISNIQEDSFEIDGTFYTTSTAMHIRYKKSTDTEYTEINIGWDWDTVISGLDASTTYDVGYRVEFTVNNVSQYTNWADTQVTTGEALPLPLTPSISSSQSSTYATFYFSATYATSYNWSYYLNGVYQSSGNTSSTQKSFSAPYGTYPKLYVEGVNASGTGPEVNKTEYLDYPNPGTPSYSLTASSAYGYTSFGYSNLIGGNTYTNATDDIYRVEWQVRDSGGTLLDAGIIQPADSGTHSVVTLAYQAGLNFITDVYCINGDGDYSSAVHKTITN